MRIRLIFQQPEKKHYFKVENQKVEVAYVYIIKFSGEQKNYWDTI